MTRSEAQTELAKAARKARDERRLAGRAHEKKKAKQLQRDNAKAVAEAYENMPRPLKPPGRR